MPSTYAHYKFGKEVYKRLPESIKLSVDVCPQLFDTGLHGPDLFFYYDAVKSNPVTKLGHGMHDLPAADFFNPALEILKNTQEDNGEKAYIYGFVCHFILDSVCHWYVEEAIPETGLSHTWIEGDFDRSLMEKDGLDPVRYMTAGHIIVCEHNARIINKFFPELSYEQTLKALSDMVFYSKLIRCRHKPKRTFILKALAALGKSDFIGGMIILPNARPQCAVSTPALEKLFNKALDEALIYLAEFEECINTDRPLSDRFSRTFGPDKESKEEYEIYKA